MEIEIQIGKCRQRKIGSKNEIENKQKRETDKQKRGEKEGLLNEKEGGRVREKVRYRAIKQKVNKDRRYKEMKEKG